MPQYADHVSELAWEQIRNKFSHTPLDLQQWPGAFLQKVSGKTNGECIIATTTQL